MKPEDIAAELKMNAADLYREEVFTDRRVGTIRRLTPIRKDGTTDESRKVIFEGQTQLMTAAGALPLAFVIDAAAIEEATAKFGAAAEAALHRTMKEIQEMRREAASSIVIPDKGMGGLPPMGGGKIKLP
jgi:hypothetical protein